MKRNDNIDPSRAEKFLQEEKKREEKAAKVSAYREKAKERRGGVRGRMGVMSAGAVAIVVAVVILLNILINHLPSNIREIDLTGSRLYEVTDVSRDYLENLGYDIELTVVAEEGTIDERIIKFLDSYLAVSNKVTMTQVDPIKNPTVLDTYPDVASNSVVVSCPQTGKSTVVPFAGVSGSLILYEFDATTQSYYETTFDAEGQITSAIDYCVSGETRNVYLLSGHNEAAFHAGISDLMVKSNVTVESINLLTSGGVPEDADMLIIYQPKADLATDELKMLRDYMQQGGQVMLFIDNDTMPNFTSLLTEYGLRLEPGYIAETENGKYYQDYYYIFCGADVEHPSLPASVADDDYLIMTAYARGMTRIDPARATIKVDSFLFSGANGHLVTETGTLDGSYLIAATSTETAESGEVLGKLTVYSCPYIISSNIIDNFANLDNQELVLTSVICDFEGVSGINVPPKDLEFGYNTISNYGFIAILFVALIPIVLLIGGLLLWTKRRKL
ncbi:MAG: GldG family protein [Oscillospiraceae bacterium]|nr:GldG family protein [Oscillospiraceae bacterium]